MDHLFPASSTSSSIWGAHSAVTVPPLHAAASEEINHESGNGSFSLPPHRLRSTASPLTLSTISSRKRISPSHPDDDSTLVTPSPASSCSSSVAHSHGAGQLPHGGGGGQPPHGGGAGQPPPVVAVAAARTTSARPRWTSRLTTS